MKLKPNTCEVLKHPLKYLGHAVSKQGMATDPEKVEFVCDWRVPTHLRKLQAFLSRVGYYRHYIADFATLTKPLTVLTSKETFCTWGNL